MAVKKSSKPGQAAIPAIAAIPADVPRVATPATVPSRKSAIKPERLVQGIPCEGSPYADDAPRLTTYGVVKMANLAGEFKDHLRQIAAIEDPARQSQLALALASNLASTLIGDAGSVPFIYALNLVDRSLAKPKRGPRAKEGWKAVAAIKILIAAGIDIEAAISEAVDIRGGKPNSRRSDSVAQFRGYWDERANFPAPKLKRSRTEAQARAAVVRLYGMARKAGL